MAIEKEKLETRRVSLDCFIQGFEFVTNELKNEELGDFMNAFCRWLSEDKARLPGVRNLIGKSVKEISLGKDESLRELSTEAKVVARSGARYWLEQMIMAKSHDYTKEEAFRSVCESVLPYIEDKVVFGALLRELDELIRVNPVG